MSGKASELPYKNKEEMLRRILQIVIRHQELCKKMGEDLAHIALVSEFGGYDVCLYWAYYMGGKAAKDEAEKAFDEGAKVG